MKRKIAIIALVILIIFTLNIYKNKDKTNNIENEKAKTKSESQFLMDTKVNIKVYGTNAEKALNVSFNKIKEIENKMSKSIKNSDVYKINKNGSNEWVEIHKSTFEVINKAIEYAKITEGRFDPTIAPLVEIWGIGTKDARIPAPEEIEKAKNLVNYKNLKLNEKSLSVKFMKEGMAIDLGGIAKGYAADEVKKILKKYNIKSAFVNLGGNVLTVGSKKDGSTWKIGIQDPRRTRGAVMAALEIRDKAVVTSGNYERYFEENDVIYHHIFNTKTGRPTRNNLVSVSIIAEESFEADILSTSAFIMGLNEGKKFIEAKKNIEAIFVTDENKVYLTSGLHGQVEIINSVFELAEKD